MIRKLTNYEKERVLTLLHCEMIDVFNEASANPHSVNNFVFITLLKRLIYLATCVQVGEVNTDSFRIVMHSELEDYLD